MYVMSSLHRQNQGKLNIEVSSAPQKSYKSVEYADN